MDHLWKYILYLVILQITALMFYISLLPSNLIELSNIRNMDKRNVYIRGKSNKSNIAIVETNKLGNNFIFLANLRKRRSVTTENPHKIQRYTGNSKMKVSRKKRVQSKTSSIFKSYKERSKRNGDNDSLQGSRFDLKNRSNTTIRNKTFQMDTSNGRLRNKSMCTFSFDKENLLEARKNLTKPYFLFYINLVINDSQRLTADLQQQDNLMHWQYVRKEEESLLQLPVDFDLLTYKLLVIDKEETVLHIPVVYNHSTCAQEDQEQRVSIIRLLLWNELFENNTNFSLCNRDFKSSFKREYLYRIATIWVGYDLYCSKVSSKGGFEEYSIEKDHLPLVTPFFCFFLSLQFVWIFALLDLKTDFNSSATDSDENEIKINPCSIPCESDQKPFYTKIDRPYGIKRFVVKILYGTYISRNCKCTCKSCQIDIQPGIRLLFLLWFTICLPFGLYRTIGRKSLLGDMYNNYGTVVRPNEPIFECICKKNDETCEWVLDIVYATVCPFIYIFLGYASYKIFLTNHSKTCCCFPEIDDDEKVIRKSKGVSDRFTFRYYQFWNILSTGGCNPNTLKCDCCSEDNCCTCCTCCGKWCRYLVLICTLIFSLIYCLLPIIPFSCFTHVTYCYCTCQSSKCKSANETGNETDNSINTSACDTNNGKLIPNKSEQTIIKICKSIVSIIYCIFFQVIRIVIPYALCLRPMISTFAFLLRSFTYFVFVALPVRAHILRYTILIVTTVTYFVKYVHEIVNMNTDILKYVFICEEENCKGDTREHIEVKNIDEEMFDYIFRRLMFVRKRLYLMFLKIIVVFMYLFITIETFITNKSSLTGSSFKEILEFLLIIIGPYAISLFLKVNKKGFLTDENKKEIEIEYTCYRTESKRKDKNNEKRSFHSQCDDRSPDICDEGTPLLSSSESPKETQICPRRPCTCKCIYLVLFEKKAEKT